MQGMSSSVEEKSRTRERPVKFGSIEPKQKKLFEDA